MKESIITVILIGCSLVSAAAAGVGIFLTDRTAPVIRLEGENSLTYEEGAPYDGLLENVTAEDDRDGDVTDSIRIGNIYQASPKKAVVVYVAKDEANNVGKMKREVRYLPAEEPDNEAEEKQEEAAADTEPEETPAAQPDNAEEPQETAEGTTPREEEEPQDGPRIRMLQTEITMKVGENFNILRFVESATDQDGTDLSRYIHADGAYDMSQPGVYEIRVYATNPAGQASNMETFTLTVEP